MFFHSTPHSLSKLLIIFCQNLFQSQNKTSLYSGACFKFLASSCYKAAYASGFYLVSIMLRNTKMLSYAMKHVGMILSIVVFFVVLPSACAQNTTSTDQTQNNYTSFSPSMAVIVAVMIMAVFFLGFFSIYIRHCSRATDGSIQPVAGAPHGRSRRRGLDPSIMETFPIFPYSEVKHHKIGKNALECAVCLNEFEDDETLRLLPKCDHVFHPECIDAWLASHTTCPVCRANLTEPVTMPPKDYFSERSGELTSTEDEVTELPTSVSVRVPPESAAADVVAERSRFSQARQWGSSSIKSLLFPRSHSTGHSLVLVQPMENTERFTLRLPDNVRNKIMNRSSLNRSTSLVALPRESSSRRGYRTGEGSSRGRYIRGLDRAGRTDPWSFTMAPPFFTRGASVKSPREKSPSNTGEGSTIWTGLIGRLSFNRLGSRRDKSSPRDSNRPPV